MVMGGTRTDGWTEGQMDGHLEIHPCFLQDIGPLGPLPKKDYYYTLKRVAQRQNVVSDTHCPALYVGDCR